MNTDSRGGSYAKVRGERRKRTVFTPSHIQLLKKAFEANPYPGYKTREELARSIGMEEDRVHVWFQNRRARTPKRIRNGNPATAPYSRSEGTSPISKLDSTPRSTPETSQNILMQQYYQPQNFAESYAGQNYAESYRGAGFWQPPPNNIQPGEQLYAPQQQSSLEQNQVHHQQAAMGGTGPNCPVPYNGGEMVRQPPPSAATFSMASSSYTPWSAMGSYPAANPGQMLDVDGSVSGSQFCPFSQGSEQNSQTAKENWF